MNEEEIIQEEDDDIIYTLRTAHQNQIQLNVMADQKANILVGTIAIILTFLFTKLSFSDFESTNMLYAVAVFVLFEAIALFLGILVVRPRGNRGKIPPSIENIPNPLFFGFFTAYKHEEYCDFMMQKLTNNKAARKMMISDLYQIGQVLSRKYTMLKYAYNFATAGVVLALMTFTMLLIQNLMQ